MKNKRKKKGKVKRKYHWQVVTKTRLSRTITRVFTLEINVSAWVEQPKNKFKS